MRVTEAEALTKWCPFTREGITARERVVDGKPGPDASRCIGSRCMAWRWSEYATPTGDDPRRGFCGLAGAILFP